MSDPTPRDTRLFDAGASWATEPTDRWGYGDALRDAVERAAVPGDRDRELAALRAAAHALDNADLDETISEYAADIATVTAHVDRLAAPQPGITRETVIEAVRQEASRDEIALAANGRVRARLLGLLLADRLGLTEEAENG